MDVNNLIWLYIFIAFFVILLLYYIKNFSKLKIDIRRRVKSGTPLVNIGYLEMDGDGSAGEVKLPGGGSFPSVGRVIIEKQAGRENGYVQVVTTDIQDETEKPKYKQSGYICFNAENVIDKYGYVYRQERGKKGRVLIGYCARPSDPNTPTIYGERNWRTLWLKCTLNFYTGKPKIQQADGSPEATAKSTHAKLVGIGALEGEESATTINTSEEPAIETIDTPTIIEEQAAPINDSANATSLMENSESSEPANGEENSIVEEVPQESDIALEPAQPEVATPKVETDNETQPEVADTTQESNKEDSAIIKEEEKSAVSEEKNEDKKKKKKKKEYREPAASASFVGFHSSARDILPAEARACAFAALAGDLKRGENAEFFKSQPYGWKDTALLSTLIYCALYFTLYGTYHLVLKRSMVGEDPFAIIILSALYFIIWALVRLVKIDYIENSNSFQKSLDILNKNLGLKGFNFAIIVFCFVAFIFSILEENFDFLPLIFAILVGVLVTMMLKGANLNWIISTSYNEKSDDDTDDDEIRNPEGDIIREYSWELDPTYSSQQLRGNVTLYFTSQEISDMRQCNPFFAQRKEKSSKEYILEIFNFLKEYKHFTLRIRYIAKYINELIAKNGLTPLDKIQFTLDFVQEPNIRFVSNKDCSSIGNYEDYIRYPDETLYDKEGDSNSKSLLAAMLFNAMGYNVMYLSSRKYKCAAVAIEIDSSDVEDCWYGSNIDDIFIREDNKYYLYCETTGDRFKVGKTINGISISDYEDRVVLETEEGVPSESEEYAKSVIYNWDLDSEFGHNLHGNLVLKFYDEQINTLRISNPFMTYGYDSNTYESNVNSMFRYLAEDDEASQNVTTIAEYIRSQVESAELPELDMVQFTLNFVQIPNIAYRLDEDCANIDFKKEYMRFPDETLYDKEGDCDCKSFLAANILHKLGYNVLFLLSQKLKHAGIAVECKEEWLETIGRDKMEDITLEHNGRLYIYCESTGSGNRVGHIKEGDSIKDFETIVDMPA